MVARRQELRAHARRLVTYIKVQFATSRSECVYNGDQNFSSVCCVCGKLFQKTDKFSFKVMSTFFQAFLGCLPTGWIFEQGQLEEDLISNYSVF